MDYKKKLLEIANEKLLKTPKIVVIGDVMLDEYYHVNIDRISPEFPIPVIHTASESPDFSVPGGAGNVAAQMQCFHADAVLFSCWGELGDGFLQSADWGFDTHIEPNHYPIIKKKRFYTRGIPLNRWDVENLNNLNDEKWKSGRRLLERAITKYINNEKPAVVVLSDYDKGIFKEDYLPQNIINLCNKLHIPTIIDPKHNPINRWENCTVFRLNEKEAHELTPHHTIEQQSKYLIDKLSCEYVVITEGKRGIHIRDKEMHTFYRPDIKTASRSEIGAGDCFVATMAVCIAHNIGPINAAKIAHEAGAIYVQKHFNIPLSSERIHEAIDPVGYKIQTPQSLKKFIKKSGKTVVITNGVFDLLHDGHIKTLEFAKSQGDILIVAVDNDANVKRLKGNDRPIQNLEQRMRILANMSVVDFVVPFEGTPDTLFKQLKHIDILVKGSHYKLDNVIGREFVKKTVLAPIVDDISTTKIIEKIRE